MDGGKDDCDDDDDFSSNDSWQHSTQFPDFTWNRQFMCFSLKRGTSGALELVQRHRPWCGDHSHHQAVAALLLHQDAFGGAHNTLKHIVLYAEA